MRNSSFALVTLVMLAACGGGTDPILPPGPPPPPGGTGPAASLAIAAGNNQEATPSTDLPTAPSVLLRDASGQPVAGALVRFAVEAGEGAVTGDSVRSGPDGVAHPTAWQLGPLPGENRLRVSTGTLPPVVFTARGAYPVPVVLLSGSVVLPSGARLEPGSLRVVSAISDVPVTQGGAFTAVVAPDAVQLAAVHAPNGHPILFGWLDGQHSVFSVRRTAEVLAFFDLGGQVVPGFRNRRDIRQYLEGANLEVLEAAIRTALAVDPTGVTLETAAVLDARKRVLRELVGTAPARGMSIDPSGTVKSGVTVDEVGFRNITVTNNYRRRVAVFMDRVDFRDASGNSVPRSLNMATLRMPGVTYATSVLGTVAELISGGMPTIPVVSEPMETALFPSDALATHYRVTVLGPGGGAFNPATLPSEQRIPYLRAAFETWILDVALPVIDQILALDNDARTARGEEEMESIVHTFLDVNPTAAVEALNEGNISQVMDEIRKTLFDSGLYQGAVSDLVLGTFKRIWKIPAGAVAARIKEWSRVFTAIEVAATGYAVYKSVSEIQQSKQVEQWDVTVSAAEVALSPPNALINNGDIQLFTATVLDATGGGPTPVFHYHWSTTGNFGKIFNATHPASADSFPSSSERVTYSPNSLKEGTDEVRVRVTVEINGQEFPIGETKSTVKTWAAKVSLAPSQVSLKVGQSQRFEARLDTQLQDGGTLSYLWSTPGEFGTFLLGQTSVESSEEWNLYTVNKNADGSEPIAVEVFSTKNGTRKSLGRATAIVLVEQDKPSIIQGSFTVVTTNLAAGRTCSVAYLTFPLIASAMQYDIYAHGFHDPIGIWSTEIHESVTPGSVFAPCAGNSWGNSGESGGQYWFFIASGAGPASGTAAREADFRSRFAGMIVEVTVHY